MSKTRRGAAFYVETLLLVLFLLMSLAVMVRMLGAARTESRRAQDLSTAVTAAQSAAETLAVSHSAEEFVSLLDAQQAEDGLWEVWLDAAGTPVQNADSAVYRLTAELDATPAGEGALLRATLCVQRGQETIYTLETQRYAKDS